MSRWKAKRGSEELSFEDVGMLREHARQGKVGRSDYVFNPILEKWMYAADVLELREAFTTPSAKPRMGNVEATAIGCAFVVAVVFVGWLVVQLLGSGLALPIFGFVTTALFVVWVAARLRK
jgi:hypothetical protein